MTKPIMPMLYYFKGQLFRSFNLELIENGPTDFGHDFGSKTFLRARVSVGRSVGCSSVGRSVTISYMDGKLHFHAPIGVLLHRIMDIQL